MAFNSSNSWAPNEDATVIYAEATWLQGELLSNIAYGIELTLFTMCFWILARETNRGNYKRQLFMLTFISLIFILGTVFMGGQAKFTQDAFIEDRNFPGGPSAFEQTMFSITANEISVSAFVVGNWLMDALLVWRCTVIYKDVGRLWVSVLLLLPSLMLCTSIALGITLLVQTADSSPFADVNITLAYYVMSLSLNVIVTFLIVGRLLIHRRQIAQALGPSHASSYTNIAAILIESASLYTLFAIMFLVPFGLSSSLANVFLQTVSQVQTVSSLLIIFRVATGRAWEEDTSVQLPTISVGSIQIARSTDIQFITSHTSMTMDSTMSKPENEGGFPLSLGTHGRSDHEVLQFNYPPAHVSPMCYDPRL